MRPIILTLLLLALGTPVAAVEPGEVLDDPALEARARELSKGLRCLVCRNESIDESNADLARDLRLLVRERMLAGDSDTQAMDFIVARYGEFVLLEPTRGGSNLILWGAGPAMLVLAGLMGGLYLRRRNMRAASGDATLSTDEEEKLAEILRK